MITTVNMYKKILKKQQQNNKSGTQKIKNYTIYNVECNTHQYKVLV